MEQKVLFPFLEPGDYGDQPKFNFENDIKNIEEAIKFLKKFPEPVTYDQINFIDKDTGIKVFYTDCFQISLLRFLHCVFSTGQKINHQRIASLMNQSEQCNQLKQFLKKYEKVWISAKQYQTKRGFIQRSDWCVFLNKRKFIKYKKQQKYQVCASLDNLFAFFNHFFPKINLQLYDAEPQKLNYLMKTLSFDFKISCNLYTMIKVDESYYVESYLKIYFDENNIVDWLIYQYFDNDVDYPRITGHSDYKVSPNYYKLIKMKEQFEIQKKQQIDYLILYKQQQQEGQKNIQVQVEQKKQQTQNRQAEIQLSQNIILEQGLQKF